MQYYKCVSAEKYLSYIIYIQLFFLVPEQLQILLVLKNRTVKRHSVQLSDIFNTEEVHLFVTVGM
jgi:hypothetical protein